MFEIGFFELCLVAIVALLVIGPEKLPRVARTVGLWLGKAQGMVKTVKYEIDEQLRAEELKQSIQRAKDDVKNNFSESIEDVETAFKDIQSEIKEEPAEDIKPAAKKPEEK